MSQLINQIEEEKGVSLAYIKLRGICNKIFIARNISMSNADIVKQLEEIDKLFADIGEN
jgi:succinyl-CoA synthetase beta subunit